VTGTPNTDGPRRSRHSWLYYLGVFLVTFGFSLPVSVLVSIRTRGLNMIPMTYGLMAGSVALGALGIIVLGVERRRARRS
jgi:hypothetical protein